MYLFLKSENKGIKKKSFLCVRAKGKDLHTMYYAIYISCQGETGLEREITDFFHGPSLHCLISSNQYVY